MIENQQNIHAWSRETFGECDDLALFAARINEEMAELVRVCCGNTDPSIFGEDVRAEFAGEAADLIIMLCSLSEIVGFDLHEAVNRKMAINRARTWNVSNDGFGHHHAETAK